MGKMMKGEAKSAMKEAYERTRKAWQDLKIGRLTFSFFKRATQSSIYSSHQGEAECQRRLFSYPSRDLSRQGR
jgi:hypothetical protein